MGIFYRAISILFKDKTILCLSAAPVLIGGTLYFFLGSKLYQLVMVYGRERIHDLLGDSSGASFTYGVLFVFFMAILFFVVNWTFVMAISLISCPLNDIMSKLVEKRYTDIISEPEPEKFSLLQFLQRARAVLWNECKKILVIALLTLLASALSLIPPLALLGSLAMALLLAIQFIDYSWARHQWRLGRCAKDSLKHLFSYTFGGIFFMLLMSLPGINLLAMPVAVIYFTLLWAHKNPNLSKTT